MKITDKKPNVTTIGQTTFEANFKIGNLGRILGILRNQMYSNNIKAIAREIASNARDAHREAGVPERPIEIHIPNPMDPLYRIKDYGPGIDPDRMEHVFIQYGTSTKDESDDETGGFGLGAKTPFAYTDQFQICTVTPDGSANIKRVYTAFIDESEAGKMRLMAEAPTDEGCGTEISFEVAESDWHKFTEATLDVCQNWEPRPEFKGRTLPEWPEDGRILFLSGPGWKMFKSENTNCYGHYDNGHPSVAIVDGIQYPINKSNIDDNTNYGQLMNRGLKLYFNTGDVSLVPSREELKYDDKTQNVIKQRLDEVFEEIQKLLVTEISGCDSYIKAVKAYREFRNYLGFAIPKDFKAEWQGHAVSDPKIPLRPQNLFDRKGNDLGYSYDISTFTFRKSRRTYEEVLHKERETDIIVAEKAAIVINDLTQDRVSRARVQYMLDSKEFTAIQVITFSHGDWKEGLKRIQEDNHWKVDLNLLGSIMLSSINPPRKASKKRGGGRGSGRASYKVFVHDCGYTAYRNCDRCWKPAEVDLEEESGVYVVLSGRSSETSTQKLPITVEQITRIKNYINSLDAQDFQVHAIREKDVGRLGPNWIPLKLHLETKVNEDLLARGLDVMAVAERTTVRGCCLQDQLDSDVARLLKEIFTGIQNKKEGFEFTDDSEFVKLWTESVEAQKALMEVTSLWEIIKLLGRQPDDATVKSTCQDGRMKLFKAYPMMSYLKFWGGNRLTAKKLARYMLLEDADRARIAAEEKEKAEVDNETTDVYDTVVNG